MNTNAQPGPDAQPASEAANKPRMWMFVAWFAVVGIGMIIVVAVVVIAMGGGLNSRITELAAAGEPTSMADVGQSFAGIPDNENARLAIAALEGEIITVMAEANPIIDTPEFFEQPLSDMNSAQVRELLAGTNGLVDRVRAAIQLPQFAPLIPAGAPEAFSPNTQSRQTARLLLLEAKALAAEGKHEESAAIGLDIVRYSNHLDRNPTIMGHLIALAVRGVGLGLLNDALQSGEITKDADIRKEIRAELDGLDPSDGLINALRTERAYAIDQARNATGSLAMATLLGPLLTDIERTIEDVQKNGVAGTNSGRPAQPPIPAARQAVLRGVATARATRLLEALTAQVDEEAGVASLDVPQEARQDPFAPAEQLRVRPENGGWTIYSVGADGLDQSGQGDDVAIRKKVAGSPDE